MSLIPTPFPALKIFDVIPGWVYAAALAFVIVTAGVTIGWQHIEIADKDTKIANLERDAAELRADREKVAREHGEKVNTMERTHALQQQGIIDAWNKKLKDAEAERVRDAARAERVRRDATGAAARDRAAATGDAASCKRVADRNEVLYGMVSEGFGLVVEGRNLLATRDANVETLMNIVKNDRAAICGSSP